MNAQSGNPNDVIVERTDDGATIRLSSELAASLRLVTGKTYEFVPTEDGLLLREKSLSHSEKMAAANRIMDENYDILRELAK